jgi:putative FmdB family regulatory protein
VLILKYIERNAFFAVGNKSEVLRMPIYEYKCVKCQKVIEVMQKFTDKPLGRCPSCGGRVSRLISNCSFQLKGSGWYVTDYKKGDSGRKDRGKDEKKTEPTKSETKAEAPKSEIKESKAEAKTA